MKNKIAIPLYIDSGDDAGHFIEQLKEALIKLGVCVKNAPSCKDSSTYGIILSNDKQTLENFKEQE